MYGKRYLSCMRRLPRNKETAGPLLTSLNGTPWCLRRSLLCNAFFQLLLAPPSSRSLLIAKPTLEGHLRTKLRQPFPELRDHGPLCLEGLEACLQKEGRVPIRREQ